MLISLIMSYLFNIFILFLVFAGFNAMQVGFNERALRISREEKKVVFIAPIALVIICLIFNVILASILGIAAYLGIYYYFVIKKK